MQKHIEHCCSKHVCLTSAEDTNKLSKNVLSFFVHTKVNNGLHCMDKKMFPCCASYRFRNNMSK